MCTHPAFSECYAHYCSLAHTAPLLNDSFRSRMLPSNTATQTSHYLEDKPFFSTGLHGPHLASLDRRSRSGVGAFSSCGRACGFDSDSCACSTAAAVGADSNFGTKVVGADAASHQHTATSCEVPVLAEATLSTSTTTAYVSRLEGRGETADHPAVAAMALQWNTTSLCLDSAAKARGGLQPGRAGRAGCLGRAKTSTVLGATADRAQRTRAGGVHTSGDL